MTNGRDLTMLDPVGDRTMMHLLDEQVQARGDQTYLIYENSAGEISELTFRQLREQVERWARGFAGAGIGHGDFVVLHLRNCPEFLFAWFAMARLGAVLVPSNVANTAGELEHLISFSEARLVITEPSLIEPVEQAAGQLPVSAGRSSWRAATSKGGAASRTCSPPASTYPTSTSRATTSHS